MDTTYVNKWEKRWHPLREEWVVYAAHRNSRPWSFDKNSIQTNTGEIYDPTCYLCPANKRVHGDVNPNYTGVFIFDNDHPVVGINAPKVHSHDDDFLYVKETAYGVAKVVCYHPHHNTSLSQLPGKMVADVFYAFRAETTLFKNDPTIKSILIFENKGKEVGVSNPHPHCQIYATDFIFKFVDQHIKVSNDFKRKTGKNIFEQILKKEMDDGIRIIAENNFAVAFIPYFARYAYEVMIFPKKRHADLSTLSDDEIEGLASVFHTVIRKYDLIYQISFPYVMSVVQAPVDGDSYQEFHMYLWLQPPLRQPGLIKYLAGPEIGIGNFMADTMPEEKAQELKNIILSEI
ncbi:MAG: galactose-1-phosphate uridylyltransferase [Cytophagaceae bacterium]|nr:galactose-1-phosphate uridylyltransferase [Cytophagaceae bacterium]MDW8456472.1 galactose-1-phosphate uridylyltransferase [Cytophagaceae bacterium]